MKLNVRQACESDRNEKQRLCFALRNTSRVQFESTQDEKGVVVVNCAEMTEKMIDWHVASSNPCWNNNTSVEMQLIQWLRCQKHCKRCNCDVIVPTSKIENFSIQKSICNQNYPISSSLHSFQPKVCQQRQQQTFERQPTAEKETEWLHLCWTACGFENSAP